MMRRVRISLAGPRPAMPEAATTYLSGKRSSTALTRRALSSGVSKASQTIRAVRQEGVQVVLSHPGGVDGHGDVGAAAARMSRRASVLGRPSWG